MGGLKKLEMFFVKLDVDRLRLALCRSTPHYPSKRTRLNVSLLVIFTHVEKRGKETQEKEKETYTTEVHSQPSLQSSFPSWQILPLLNTLSQGLKDLFKRWSTIHCPRP
jgi:hypothetical protein